MKKKTFLLLFAGMVSGLCAQDFSQRIKDVREKYANLDHVDVTMVVKIYAHKGDASPYYHEVAEIRKDDLNYYSKFSGTEMLMNEKYLLVADVQSKHILCAKRNLKSEKDFARARKFDLDSILSFYETPEWHSLNDTLEVFRVQQKKGDVTAVELMISRKTNALKQITYEYKAGQYAVIEFMKFNTSPLFSESDFAIDRYVVNAGTKKARTSELFSRYRLTMN